MKLSGGPAVVALACGAVALVGSTNAGAAPLNDRSCKAADGRPPVVLVHGQGGDVIGMGAIYGALSGAGYCVFGTNYGQETPGGLFGRARLDVSGQQIADFVQGVLHDTGATKVNVVGHSAGTGVLANYILLRGGAGQVANAVSFGGLHHPYAHLGLANVIDTNVFLPNTVAALQGLFPPFTSKVRFQDLAVGVLGLGSSIGLNLPPRERELVTSGFVSDLFDPQYWAHLHGGLSEPPGAFVSINASERSLRTKDAAPNVCYTNIVGVADFITGANAGFQDEASNVENFVLTSLADHVQMISDPTAIEKMLAGLSKTCAPGDGDGKGPVPDGPYH
jgi:pimeloyl-ACP methyl ester carboxylesterase